MSPKGKFEYYTRRCRRCEKLYRTTARTGKFCDACKKPAFKAYQRPIQNEVKDGKEQRKL